MFFVVVVVVWIWWYVLLNGYGSLFVPPTKRFFFFTSIKSKMYVSYLKKENINLLTQTWQNNFKVWVIKSDFETITLDFDLWVAKNKNKNICFHFQWQKDSKHVFVFLNFILMLTGFIKLQLAMPFLKRPPTSPPLSTLLDIKSQKCGLRHTVFSASGNEYTGEWQNNKKHGEI